MLIRMRAMVRAQIVTAAIATIHPDAEDRASGATPCFYGAELLRHDVC